MAKVSRSVLARVVADMSLKDPGSKKLARSVAAYLLEEGRIHELDSLLRDVQTDWAQKGYVDISAKTARKIDKRTVDDLALPFKSRFPTAKQVGVSVAVDPGVIGGVLAELGELRYDLSISRRVKQFKQSIRN